MIDDLNCKHPDCGSRSHATMIDVTRRLCRGYGPRPDSTYILSVDMRALLDVLDKSCYPRLRARLLRFQTVLRPL